MNRKKITNITGFLTLLFLIGLLFSCNQPATEDVHTINNKEQIDTEISFYPDSEVIYYETHGLFCSTIVIPLLETSITSYSVVFHFDPAIIQYESIYAQHALCQVNESQDSVEIRTVDTEIIPGEYVELCTVTWKALLTGIMLLSAEITATGDGSHGFPIQMTGRTAGTVKIVQETGSLHFEGSGYIQKETAFSNTMYIDSEDTIIREYDIDIYFDPAKVIPDSDIGGDGVIAGADGFFSAVTPGEGIINITGKSIPGMGPGTELEFLTLNWIAADSGRTNIYTIVNKMVTSDNVYIKPKTRSISISIYTENNKPIVDVWFEPETVTIGKNGYFMTSIYLNTVGYVIAAYGIDIIYDPDFLELDKSRAGGTGIEAGADGFLTVSNTLVPGIIRTTGFELNGRPPNPRLELLRIYWKGINATPESEILLDVKTLADVRPAEISRIRTFNCTVTVTE